MESVLVAFHSMTMSDPGFEIMAGHVAMPSHNIMVLGLIILLGC